MVMTEINESAIEEFKETALLNIDLKDTTLPIDTSAEWTKGFKLVNQLIYELAKERYVEEFVDETGEARSRPVLHPQLLSYIQERRKQIDQIFRMSGGDIVNEFKKETAKKLASFVFEMQSDPKTKEQYKKEAYKIIETEVDLQHDESKTTP